MWQIGGYYHGGIILSSVPNFDVSWVNTYTDITNASTYTFTAASIGLADASRKIYLIIHYGGTAASLTSTTIGGTLATVHVHAGAASGRSTAIVSADIAAGTTADIITNFNVNTSRCVVCVYRVVGQTSGVTTASDTTLTANACDVSLNVTTLGAVIAGWTISLSGGTTTWVGVDEKHDAEPEAGFVVSSGFTTNLGTETPRTVTATASGAATAAAAVAVSISK